MSKPQEGKFDGRSNDRKGKENLGGENTQESYALDFDLH
jgi:hypothetical protein